MASNRGKDFEERFKEDWDKCFPGTLIFRLKDQMNGFKQTSQNPCDFIGFPGKDTLFMIECKSHNGASISFSAIPQYERLLEYKNKKGVFCGILIWFIEHDKIYWVPEEVAEQIYNSGEKSIGLRHVGKYNLIEVPSVKKRVFMTSDLSFLLDIRNVYNQLGIIKKEVS